MYAIIRDGGKQYRVQKGMELDLELKNAPPGETLELDDVLFIGGDQTEALVGAPTVEEAKVIAEVRGEAKGKKQRILHWRRRKSSRTRKGHRQRYTRVAIKDIVTGKEDTGGA